tara:strand:+ start:179 stop:406 length:228 start_codon:yes stop_codon:yes gene_type:complete
MNSGFHLFMMFIHLLVLLAYGSTVILSILLHLVIYVFMSIGKAANEPLEVKVVTDETTEELLQRIKTLEKKLEEK